MPNTAKNVILNQVCRKGVVILKDKSRTHSGGFSSKLGFVLAAAGSAVGLGNIWRFPYLAAKYGGGIFLVVYIVIALTFGFTLAITEYSIGRKTGKSVLNAYSSINKKFGFLGIIGAVIPAIIVPYYCVIGGWVMKYLTVFVTDGTADAATDGFFGSFIGNAGGPVPYFVVFTVLTALVVMLGVQNGIEKISKIMMPVLIVLTIIISIYSLTLPGALDGLKFYLMPDFENFSMKTVVAAMGQLFYSMSLAMGISITYGSYMRKDDNIESSVHQVEIFDTGIAFLSGLMIIPAVFVFSGGDESKLNQGPGLMFITLPKVFDSMPFGNIMGIVFFLLVTLAALTSAISLMEAIVRVAMEQFRIKRVPACLCVIALIVVLGMVSILGYSSWSEVSLFGMQMLDFFDYISNNILMPLLALLTCILIGYVAKTKYIEEEVELNSRFRAKHLYRIMIKFVCPVCLIAIFISSIIGYV